MFYVHVRHFFSLLRKEINPPNLDKMDESWMNGAVTDNNHDDRVHSNHPRGRSVIQFTESKARTVYVKNLPRSVV
jgi:hypothetical protein